MEKNYALNNCKGGCENLGLNQEEYYHYLISNHCVRCPLKCHSTSWKFDRERAEKEKNKKLGSIKKLEEKIHTMRQEICSKCGKYKESHLGKCDGCRWQR